MLKTKLYLILIFAISLSLISTVEIYADGSRIPNWVKNNAGWWADDIIPDTDFIQGIQFLIKDGIIVIPPTAVSAEKSQSIPDWVKSNAKWWADDIISDTDFINGIQYLIKTGVISVPISDSKSSDSVPNTTSTDGVPKAPSTVGVKPKITTPEKPQIPARDLTSDWEGTMTLSSVDQWEEFRPNNCEYSGNVSLILTQEGNVLGGEVFYSEIMESTHNEICEANKMLFMSPHEMNANMFGSGFSGKYFGLDAKGQFTTDLLKVDLSGTLTVGGIPISEIHGQFTTHRVK